MIRQKLQLGPVCATLGLAVLHHLYNPILWPFRLLLMGHFTFSFTAAFLSRKIESSGQLYRLEMWDTAGQERYRSLAPMYYRHANAALVCFSIISLATFQGATSWIEELKMRTNPDIILVLVGCKSDLEDRREVFPTHIGELVESFGAVYVECSAKTDTKIDDIFFEIVQQASKRKHLIPKLKDTEIIPTSTIVESTASSKGCAC